MIYEHEEKKRLKIVEFGHGSVQICPQNDPETMIASSIVLIYDGMKKPIGTKILGLADRCIEEFDNAVILKFLGVEPIDILIQDLQTVRRGMLESLSVQQARTVE